jgi:hypothetical protein
MKKSQIALQKANAAGYGLGRDGKNRYYLARPDGSLIWFDSMKGATDYAAANPIK